MKVDFAKLDRAFNPQCVAVVGDNPNGMWLRAQSNFKGKLYSIQLNPETIKAIEALGIRNYTSLCDIPETVDLAIVTVPRAAVPGILEDCITKKVAAAQFYTAGYSESATEEGIRLERCLAERAEETNFHFIGPNCMGILSPRAGVGWGQNEFAGIAGSVGFISQSGTHTGNFALEAHLQGVGIGKCVSFGNGMVLDSPDFLEYFGQDPEVKAIGMYLEGVRDGRRFLKVLREVAARKPVVIWKGGRTEEGGRAIASHTGSLAVPQAVWEAVVKQGGAIRVSRMEELIDTHKALLYLPPVRGDRVAIIAGSGGHSVVIADVFAEAGLRVPLLTQQSYDEFATFYTIIGGGYRNPIDIGNPNREQMKRILEILERDANVDNLVLLPATRPGALGQVEDAVELMASIRERSPKPVMAIVAPFTPDEVTRAREVSQKLQEKGIPAFPSMERGALALRRALDYYHLKGGADD